MASCQALDVLERGRGNVAVPSIQDRPTISIGLPVFNGEQHLAQALTSLLDQTYTDFEIVISEGFVDRSLLQT